MRTIKNKFCIFMSLSCIIIGVLCGIYINQQPTNSNLENNNLLKHQKISNLEEFILILKNNLKVYLMLLLGSLTFGLSTFYILFFNGLSIPILLSNVKLIDIVAYVIPHAIFEFLGFIIAGAVGFKIPYEITLYLLDKKEKPITEEDIKEFLKLALISIVLIIIAAFVEVYITPEIANYLLT
ncbi:protein of unknown function DUF95 transmembrane [Methanococcus aeolicus Nankai-3]|uniref:Stage II sporulation protein M n=2 Tax=Methanococcus aeolicus TaxID=42879 RepID=A6UUD8_META3|nr:protein of unknown function DUF95 transmembrane [Methanococcus aeolicus Nankai-3]